MKEKLVKALKTKFANLGFSDKAFTGVADYLAATVTEEDQIETAIAGVEPLLKALQGDIDKRVTDAVAKAKAEKEEKGGDQQPDKETQSSTQTGELAELKQMLTGLTQTVSSIVEKDKQKTVKQKWESLAKEKGVTNPKLIEKWQPQKEEDFEDAITDLLDFNTEIETDKSNSRSTGRPPAGGGATITKKGEAILDDWLKDSQPPVTEKEE